MKFPACGGKLFYIFVGLIKDVGGYMILNVTKCEIEGVFVLEPKVFGDQRGYFLESYSNRDFKEATGLDIDFVQDNESMSSKGVLRGLHFQKSPHAQAKLVRVVKGAVQDVAVDIRPDSSTFGKYVSVVLSGENKKSLFIPEGFAHGFLVLEDDTIFQYKCSDYYAPSSEGSVKWNDPQIGIEWILPEQEYLISDKDKIAPPFSSLVK